MARITRAGGASDWRAAFLPHPGLAVTAENYEQLLAAGAGPAPEPQPEPEAAPGPEPEAEPAPEPEPVKMAKRGSL